MNTILPACVEKSVEMLAIIPENRTPDIGATVWMTTIRNAIADTCFAKGSGNFVSSVEKNQKKIDSAIKAVTDAITGN